MPMRLCALGWGCLRSLRVPNSIHLVVRKPSSRDIRGIPDRVSCSSHPAAVEGNTGIGRALVVRSATHGATTTRHTAALAGPLLARAATATAGHTPHNRIGNGVPTVVHLSIRNRIIPRSRSAQPRVSANNAIKVPATHHLLPLCDAAVAAIALCAATTTSAHKRTTTRHLLFGRKKYAQRPRTLIISLPPPNRS
jgi:hypothetical protein